MTTIEAFTILISEPGIHAKLGFKKSTVHSYRNRLKCNKVSIKTMENILILAKWKKEPESWQEPYLNKLQLRK